MNQFEVDLKRVAEGLASYRPLARFLQDLERVHDEVAVGALRDINAELSHLEMLGDCFRKAREATLSKLGGTDWLQRIPVDDPLRCTVGLFTTLDLGLRETAHTNALTWLLNPSEEHEFGHALLRPLVREIFGFSEVPNLSGVSAVSEFPTKGERGRLDLHITGVWTLPGSSIEQRFRAIIETKIDADEGSEQCSRYEDHASRTADSDECLSLVFLTRDGREPSTAAKGGPVRWHRLSFIRLMAMFRGCLEELKDRPGIEFLRLYMTGVLKDICKIECGRPDSSTHPYALATYLGSIRPKDVAHV
jgi:hypothetical protein